MAWEYKVISPERDFRIPREEDLERHLNSWGTMGWELVAVTDTIESGVRMYLKRVKPVQ